MTQQGTFLSKLRELVVDTVKEIQPDLIIAIDRKGTALLRALIEWTDITDITGISWKNVLSSSTLEWIDKEHLHEKQILLFDDLVYEGHAMGRVIEKIKLREIPCKITKLAFAVHQRCPPDVKPEFYYCSEVDDKQFDNLRKEIVNFLQLQGALLLDTEHIEIPIKLHCSKEEFFNALQSSGDMTEFISAGNRSSLSICNPVLLEQEKWNFRLSLPRETIFDDVVCKCRVIERPDNRYALIPIYYPCFPTKVQNEWYRGLPLFLQSNVGTTEKDEKRNFYTVALIAGLEVIKSIFSSLSTLIAKGRIVAELPQPNAKGDTLSHLLVLYPDLSIKELHKEVLTAMARGQTAGGTGKVKKEKKTRYVEGEDFLFEKTIWPVLGRIWEYTELSSSGPIGASFPEILDCSKGLRMDEAIVSASLDKTIDEGFVLTGVEKAIFPDGIERMIRVFRPDGERIAYLIRRYVSTL